MKFSVFLSFDIFSITKNLGVVTIREKVSKICYHIFTIVASKDLNKTYWLRPH